MTSVDGPESPPEGPSATAVRFRPLGYALGAVLWLIFLCVFVTLAVLLGGLLAGRPLAGWVPHGNPLDVLGTVFGVVLLGMCVGIILQMVVASLANVGLATLLTGRSLRADYRLERLSGTTSVDGIGPSKRLGLSFQPIRRTRVSDAWTRLAYAGWAPGGTLVLGEFLIGTALVFTVGWLAWPVTAIGLVILFAVVSLGLAVVGIDRYRRGLLAVGREPEKKRTKRRPRRRPAPRR